MLVSTASRACAQLAAAEYAIQCAQRSHVCIPGPWFWRRPFPRKLQQAWDRLKADQAAVTKKLKGMKFDYVSWCAEALAACPFLLWGAVIHGSGSSRCAEGV